MSTTCARRWPPTRASSTDGLRVRLTRVARPTSLARRKDGDSMHKDAREKLVGGTLHMGDRQNLTSVPSYLPVQLDGPVVRSI
eukprot:4657867-Prymnesium_polylepis.3